MKKLDVNNSKQNSKNNEKRNQSENFDNNYNIAINYYTKGINDDNSNIDFLIKRATINLAKGYYSLSLKDSLKAIELNPDNSKGNYFAALSYIEMLELEKAEKLSKDKKIQLLIENKKNEIKERIKIDKSYPKFINMVKELYKYDSFFPKVDIIYLPNEYRGIIATSEIKKDEVIIIIPYQCLISLDLASQTLIGKEISTFINDNNNKLNSPKHSLLSSFLLSEEKNPKWKFYFDILPKDFSSFPIFFNEKELEYLKGSPTLNQILNKKKDIKEDYDKLCKNIKEFSKFSFQKFCESRMIISSRVFGIELENKKTDVLVPFADLLNHKRPKETIWYYNNSLKGFVIQAIQDIKKGSEIFYSYGIKCNSRFLLNYGFALENNDYMEVIFNINFNDSYPLFNDKKKCFKNDNNYIQNFVLSNVIKFGENDFNKILSFIRFLMYDGELNSLKDAMRFKDKSNNEEYFSFYDIKILSKDLEINVLKHFRSLLIQNLLKYPTSYEQDQVNLKKKNISVNQKNCIWVIMSEKYVLLYYIYFCEYCLSLFKISIDSKINTTLKFNFSQLNLYIEQLKKLQK